MSIAEDINNLLQKSDVSLHIKLTSRCATKLGHDQRAAEITPVIRSIL